MTTSVLPRVGRDATGVTATARTGAGTVTLALCRERADRSLVWIDTATGEPHTGIWHDSGPSAVGEAIRGRWTVDNTSAAG